MDRSLPGSSIHGIFQAKALEWGAIAFSKQEGLANSHYILNCKLWREKGRIDETIYGKWYLNSGDCRGNDGENKPVNTDYFPCTALNHIGAYDRGSVMFSLTRQFRKPRRHR